MKNKILRRFLYALPVVAFGATAITCFAVSASIKKEYTDNKEVQTLTALITKIQKDYIEDQEAYTNPDGVAYEEYTLANNRLNKIAGKTDTQYRIFSTTAYVTSILTLVSFGVVLYVSDKVKEKEETYVEETPSKEEEEKLEEEELEELEKEAINE